MEAFGLLVLVVAIIIAAAFVFFKWFKKTTVEDLGLHYGEKMIFDDDTCSVELPAGSSTEPMTSVFLRVTNKRIVIGLGGKRKHLLKYVVYYETVPGKSSGGPGDGKKEYVSFNIEIKNISFIGDDVVRIEPATTRGGDIPEWLQIKTNHIGNYREAFRV
ncbi:MAG: hypothetical protein KA369_22020 [Spirochaetes bacterium]|nr:hypothetical protein [Spirochaetota bacterium]